MISVRAFAPGSVANLGPGLDVLGLAVTGAGDTVTAERTGGAEVRIRSSGHPDIPAETGRNTAGIAAMRVLVKLGAVGAGIALEIEKGLPLAGGQGGSAASAVAAAVAVNALFDSPLPKEDLLDPCLEAEAAVAGRHADNLAAALFGGAVLIRTLEPLDVVRLVFPPKLLVVLAQPRQMVRTEEARSRLPRLLPLSVAIAQAASVGALVAAFATSDWELLRRSVEDRVAEPARVSLLPGFREAKAAALAAGALGCSISGSGPSSFAFSHEVERAHRIGVAMVEAYGLCGVEADARVCAIDSEGARIVGVRD